MRRKVVLECVGESFLLLFEFLRDRNAEACLLHAAKFDLLEIRFRRNCVVKEVEVAEAGHSLEGALVDPKSASLTAWCGY